MEKIIFGERGSGKTTRIIDDVVHALREDKNVIVLSAYIGCANDLLAQIASIYARTVYGSVDESNIEDFNKERGAICALSFDKYNTLKRKGKFFNRYNTLFILDDIDSILRDYFGEDNFIASVSINSDLEIKILSEKHSTLNIKRIAEDRVLQGLKGACFASEDVVETDFKEHREDILAGNYTPTGMSSSLYHHLLKELSENFNIL